MIPRPQETQTGRRPLFRADHSRFKRYSLTAPPFWHAGRQAASLRLGAIS
jgi:hypothetical protein